MNRKATEIPSLNWRDEARVGRSLSGTEGPAKPVNSSNEPAASDGGDSPRPDMPEDSWFVTPATSGGGDIPRQRAKAAGLEPPVHPGISGPAARKPAAGEPVVEETAPSTSAGPFKGEPRPKRIPVQDLTDGIIDTLGDGLAMIINGSRAAGGVVATEVKDVTMTVATVSGARAGLRVFFELVDRLTAEGKWSREKVDA